MVMLSKFVQLSNAPLPMLVTLSGMVTLLRFVQFRNAYSPMLVMLAGISTVSRFLCRWNVYFPIFVTPSGILTVVSALVSILFSPINIMLARSMKQNFPLSTAHHCASVPL